MYNYICFSLELSKLVEIASPRLDLHKKMLVKCGMSFGCVTQCNLIHMFRETCKDSSSPVISEIFPSPKPNLSFGCFRSYEVRKIEKSFHCTSFASSSSSISRPSASAFFFSASFLASIDHGYMKHGGRSVRSFFWWHKMWDKIGKLSS